MDAVTVMEKQMEKTCMEKGVEKAVEQGLEKEVDQQIAKIALRYQRVGDAKKFWEILNHPDFIHFPVRPKTIKAEREYLRLTREKRQKHQEYSFAITLQGEVIGGIGVMIDQRRQHIGEIGYFIERQHWGKGLASQSVGLIEQFIEQELALSRIELTTMLENRASARVAEKCGYQKEGIQRGKVYADGEYVDVYAYAKLLGSNR